MKRTAMAVTWLAVYFLSAGLSIAQQTRTWNGPATGDWFTAANWLPASDYPRAGDTVVVTNGSVLLSQPTESLASFSITNATLLFTNWTTRLQAANVTILNKGIMTLPLATATNAMTNRIHVVCETLVVDAGGQILADGKGFKTAQGPGKGVSNGSNFNTGGGHGGKGGDGVYGAGGITNDAPAAPVLPGSGGGDYTSDGDFGPGGGVVRIEATNVTINGTLTADGGTGGTYDGGGAGGSIWISCASFGGGTSGVVRARGGTGGYGYVTDTSGGGGRIAIIYSSLIGTPGAQFSVAPGSNYTYPAEYGTLYLPDTALVTQPFNNFQGVRLVIPGFNSLNADSLVVSNSIVSFGDGDFILTVTNNLTIWSNSWLALGGVMYGGTQALKSVTVTATNPIVRVGGNVLLDRGGLTLGGANQLSHVFMTVGTNLSITGGGILKLGGNLQTAFSALTVGGNLVVTNNGQLHVYCGISNAVKRYGGRVAVSGSTSIAGGGWIFPYSHQTNGAAVLFDLKDLLVGTSSGFNADNNGFAWIGATCYAPSYGATYGSRGAGSGHGGAGGSITLAAGGRPYGSTNAPLLPGAPGGYGYGNPSGFAQPGGGVVQIHAGNITLNGQVKASQTLANSYGGGGGGGGIFITCDTFNGASTGVLRADGGNGGTSGNPQGGGGGGRISLAIGFSDTNIEKLILGQPVAGLAEVPSHGTYLGIFSVTNGVGNGTGNPGTLGTVRILKIRYPGTLIDLR